MPKELYEIRNFSKGTVTNIAQSDIHPESASASLDIDPIAEDGKLVGIPEDTKIEDNVGGNVNILLNNVTDSSKHDLIYYKNSDNTVYKAEDIYSGSATGSSLGVLNASGDDISMEAINGAVHLGQGTGANENPQWIGRADHNQWGATQSDALIMEDDSLYSPNTINEATTACSDGVYLYIAYAGLDGTNGALSKPSDTDEFSTGKNYQYSAGEITKIRITDGKIEARSNKAYGYINGIALSTSEERLWVLTSKRYPVSKNDTTVTTNEHIIYELDTKDLKQIGSYTTNLHTLIRADIYDVDDSLTWAQYTDESLDLWQNLEIAWNGAVFPYQGAFSDIIELTNSDNERVLWVCTTAGAIFNTYGTDITSGSTLTFANKTPRGLGFYESCDTRTTPYIGRQDSVVNGSFNDNGSNWLIPEVHCASLMQLSNTNDSVGMYFRIGDDYAVYYRAAGANVDVRARSLIALINQNNTGHDTISQTAAGVLINRISDATPSSEDKPRKQPNVMYKSPKDVNKSAYSLVRASNASVEDWNIYEFDNPSTATSELTDITVSAVELNNTSLIPMRISNTEIIGIPSDVYNSVGDWNATDSDTAAERNLWRCLRKFTDDSGWTDTQLGATLYLSQRAFKIYETELESDYHISGYAYSYRFSFVYDGYQESPLGAAKHVISTGKTVNLNFVFTTDNFPKRVTGLRIYRAQSISATDTTIAGFHSFLKEIDIVNYSNATTSASGTGDDTTDYLDEGNEVIVSSQKVISIEDTGEVGATYEVMSSGLFEGMVDSNVKYKLSTQLNNRLFVADIKHDTIEGGANYIAKSLSYRPSLINPVDILKLPEKPTAIQGFNGRIYAFSESRTYKIEPNTFFIEDVYDGAGCIGQDAVAVSDAGMCFCDNNNIYFHTGQTPIAIGTPILNGSSTDGYLDQLNVANFSPKIIFEPKRQSFIVFHHLTNAWVFNLSRKIWNYWSTTRPNGILSGKNAEVLYVDNSGDDLYHMLASGTRKNWSWTSGKLGMGQNTQKKRWYDVVTSYEGAAPTVAIRFDYDGSDYGTVTSDTTVSNIKKVNLNSPDNKRLIRVKLTGASNTSKVDAIGFTFRRFAKLIE